MKNERFDRQTELLFETPASVVDIFPFQVPAARMQQYAAAERWLCEKPHIQELYRRFADLLLKLSCYYDLRVYLPAADDWQPMPEPESLIDQITSCAERGSLVFLFPDENALLSLNGGDLYLSYYDPDRHLIETVRALAASEGLFVRESWGQ